MAKRGLPGFDVAVAIKALHFEALSLGGEPVPGFDSSDPHAIALPHVLLHGIQTSGSRCTKLRCRLGGVCFALYELVEYQREAAQPRVQAMIAAADAAESLRAAAREELANLNQTMRALMRDTASRHRLAETQNPGIRLHHHEMMLERPLDLLFQTALLMNSCGAFARDIRGTLESRELGQSLGEKGSALLLTAVYQHLAWGKMSYPRIAELVPDGLGGADAADRVRYRVKKSPDARSIVPQELLPCTPGGNDMGVSSG